MDRCQATAPTLRRDGEPIRCTKEKGHPVGELDRHKAVFAQPVHVAVVWNEAEEPVGLAYDETAVEAGLEGDGDSA